MHQSALKAILLQFVMISCFVMYGQKTGKVELLQAGELEGFLLDGKDVRKLKNKVIFRQNDMTIFCDSAFQYVLENRVAAFGNIKIKKGDSLEVIGDVLHYNGNEKMAVITGKEVQMIEAKGAKLLTKELNFDLNKNLLFYTSGGTITHEDNTLVSKKGYYNTYNRIAYFKEKVVGTGTNYKIESDSLQYNVPEKKAVFTGPTHLTNSDGKLYSTKGEYFVESQVSKFEGRSSIVQKEYVLVADRIKYDKKNNQGNAEGNIEIVSLKDTIVVTGDKAVYSGKKGSTKVYGSVKVKFKSGADTLILKSDTLVYLSDSINNEKYISAYPKVRLYKTDIQGICDSLVYNQIDSSIYMYKAPVLWAQKSQMNADSIRLQLANSQLDKMYLRRNSIVISEDSIKNHNQVKGKNMIAFFRQNKLQKVEVNGNGESIYFATENDTLLVGMNRIACSNMIIRFKDNQLNTFTFLTKPEARFVPPHELLGPDKILKGYSWRIGEIPKREEMLF